MMKEQIKIIIGLYKELESNEHIFTIHFYTLNIENGELQDAFTLPLAVSNIVDFNDEYYLVSASINCHKGDYHLWTNEQKDKVIFDEDNLGNVKIIKKF